MFSQNKIKFTIVTALILPSQFIFAQSDSQYNNFNLGEIVFFPQKDDLYSSSGIYFCRFNSDASSEKNPSNTWNSKSFAVIYAHESHYSFYKNHTLGLALAYGTVESDNTTQSNSFYGSSSYTRKYTFKNKGLYNPILIYKTRFLEQKSDDSYNLDFSAKFSPDMFPAKYSVASSDSSGGSDGTVASGNSELAISLDLSKKMQNSNLLKSGAELKYFTKSKRESPNNGDSFSKDPYYSGNIYLQGQKFINAKLGFSIKGVLSYVSDIKYENTSNGTTTDKGKSDPLYSANGEFKIDFIAVQNKWALFSAFEYGYSFANQTRSDTDNTVFNNKNMYSTSITLGANYIL